MLYWTETRQEWGGMIETRHRIGTDLELEQNMSLEQKG